MVNDEKLKEAILKEVEKQGGELRYTFVVYAQKDKLSFMAHVNKGELHTVVGMLERAKLQLLKRIEEINK